MNRLFLLTILIAGLLFNVACSLDDTITGEVVEPVGSEYKLIINEILASNDGAAVDEFGEFEDFAEIYNYGTVAVNIAGMYVSDVATEPLKYQIPSDDASATTIEPGGFLVIWCDGHMTQGAAHVDFKLSSGGESFTLTESNGLMTIDSYTFGPQTTDVSIGRSVDGGDTWVSFEAPTPGVSNSGTVPPPVTTPNLVINEFLASNDYAAFDENNNAGDFIELYNAGDVAVDIGGMYISDTPGEETVWQIPTTDAAATTIAPGGYLVLWADKETDAGILHVNIKLSSGGESVILTDSDGTTTIDSYTYTEQVTDVSMGRFADGSDTWIAMETVTPGAANSDAAAPAPEMKLVINEFMATQDSLGFADETGNFGDWIEILNTGSEAVDIGGMYVTDDLTDLVQYQIPTTDAAATTIEPGGFLILWADKVSENGILHVEIKLSSGGEAIGLVAADGTTLIDSYTFEAQEDNISMGRVNDGAPEWTTFSPATPGASNNQ